MNRIKPRYGETIEDALIREIRYHFVTRSSNYIGPFVMTLNGNAQDALDSVLQYLEDVGATKQ